MLPDQVSNPGPLTYESGALPITLRGPAGIPINARHLLRDKTTHNLSNESNGMECHDRVRPLHFIPVVRGGLTCMVCSI